MKSLLRVSHLRNKTKACDQAIVDSLELIENGFIPRVISTKELQATWNCSQSTVSRRIDRVNNVELLRIHNCYGGYELTWGRETIKQKNDAEIYGLNFA